MDAETSDATVSKKTTIEKTVPSKLRAMKRNSKNHEKRLLSEKRMKKICLTGCRKNPEVSITRKSIPTRPVRRTPPSIQHGCAV